MAETLSTVAGRRKMSRHNDALFKGATRVESCQLIAAPEYRLLVYGPF